MALSDLDRELIGTSSDVDNDENLNKIKDLLKKGANPNASTELGSTPLHLAAGLDRRATIDLLLEYGADMEAKNHKGQTPLHVAVIEGSSETVFTLLERGADPNAKDNFGKTPLHHAAEKTYNQPFLCEMLLRKDANPLEADNAGMTPLDIAVSCFLVKYGWTLVKESGGKRLRFFPRREFFETYGLSEVLSYDAMGWEMRRVGLMNSRYDKEFIRRLEVIALLAKAAGIECEFAWDWRDDVRGRIKEHVPYALNELERMLIAMLFRLSMPYGFRPSPLPEVFLSFETPPLFVAYPELEEEMRQSREESVTEEDVRNNRCSPAERSMQGRSIVESEEMQRLRDVLSEITPPEAFPIEEVLGYYETKPRIVLYQRGLDWFSGKYGLDQELLRAVVLLHEASHWFTHLTPGPLMLYWPERAYQQASSEVHEGLAQLLSWWVVNEARGRLKYTFEELNKRQSPPYLVFEEFKSESREKILRSLEEMREVGMRDLESEMRELAMRDRVDDRYFNHRYREMRELAMRGGRGRYGVTIKTWRAILQRLES
ncbi:MAG: ankyrin repeat domain-containing protein [Thermoproteota archaeon]